MSFLQIKQSLNLLLEQVQHLHMTFPTSNTVQAPTCTGAQGLFAHVVLRQLKDTHGIRNISSSKAITQLQV
jgi:hypothetical protein